VADSVGGRFYGKGRSEYDDSVSIRRGPGMNRWPITNISWGSGACSDGFVMHERKFGKRRGLTLSHPRVPAASCPPELGAPITALRFTLYDSTHGLLNPRFIPGVTELNNVMVLLHALVVTCVNKDMIYPHFIHGL
jgi:hypothetical protein